MAISLSNNIRMKTIGIFIILAFSTPVISQELGFEEAGDYYGISPILLEAIAMVESDKTVNAININQNGSSDVCHMQINSATWKSVLGDRWQYLSDPFYCTMVGAWILKLCVLRCGETWDAVACYHTGISPDNAKTLKKKISGKRYIERVKKAVINIQEKNDRQLTGQ